MKSYDETISTVFDRIHAYNIKKQHRTVITRRIAASCCAVSLLGGGVWYVNRHPMDTPMTSIANGDNTTTTNASDTGTTFPTTTNPTEDKIIITADEPEVFDNLPEFGTLMRGRHISPALKEKMSQYNGCDVVYAVIVEVPILGNDHEAFWESNEELAQARNEYYETYRALVNEVKRLNPSWREGAFIGFQNVEIWTDEMQVALNYLDSHWDILHDLEIQYRDSYYADIQNQRVQILKDINTCEVIPLYTDTRFYPFFSHDPNYAFFMELTAEEINSLADSGNYVIRLLFPDGDSTEILFPE